MTSKAMTAAKQAATMQRRILVGTMIAFIGWIGIQWAIARAPDFEAAAFPIVTDFSQTFAWCEGDDAMVSGTMRKVRGAEYVRGGQSIYAGTPDGVHRRMFYRFEDQPMNSPAPEIRASRNGAPGGSMADAAPDINNGLHGSSTAHGTGRGF